MIIAWQKLIWVMVLVSFFPTAMLTGCREIPNFGILPSRLNRDLKIEIITETSKLKLGEPIKPME